MLKQRFFRNWKNTLPIRNSSNVEKNNNENSLLLTYYKILT